MKYMHFKGSCSYAGIANMLELSGYDTEDYIIANKIKLPYMFDYVDGTYLAERVFKTKSGLIYF